MFSRLIVIAVILRGPRPNDGTALPDLIEQLLRSRHSGAFDERIDGAEELIDNRTI